MGEILLKGGTVIDGTGAPRQEADVLISDDKIKSIGKGLGTTGKVIDVTGLTVTPGIIDPHTHLDGQFFFEPTGSSSCWHGVTTVMMGHCGYSLAPISPEHRDYIIHMFARVEEVSPQLFEEQIPWNWVTFPEYMDRLESNGLGINAIPQVGHSTLRYHVMGPEAIQREATEDEVTRMRQIFHNAVEAGAFGFTTARAGPHVDWDGTPVPSRWAATSEILKLAQELQRMKVGTLELNPAGVLQGITPEDKDLIIDMARESGGKTVQIPGGARSAEARQFMIDIGKQGVNLYTVTSPQAFFRVFTFAEGTVLLNSLDTWMAIRNAPTQDRLRRLESPDIRQKLREEIDAEPLMETTGMRQPKINWQETRVIKAAKPENRVFEGKSLLELAADQSKHLVDAMLDLAASEDWKTQFASRSVADSAWFTSAQEDLLKHPNLYPMNTDRGAHLANFSRTGDATYFLHRWVMDRGIMSIEDGFRTLTSDAARWIGLPDRGALKDGMVADVAVFDLGALRCLPNEQVWDLPGGFTRWVQGATGVQMAFVNGKQTLRDGKHTGEIPGKVIRNTPYR